MRRALPILALLLLAAPADARHRCRPRRVVVACPVVVAAPAVPVPATPPAPPLADPGPAIPSPQAGEPVTAAPDPYGFVSWLNGVRSSRGLGPVAWDPGLAADAAVNSGRGFGHSYFGGGRRHNVGHGDLAAVESMWLASPAHASALLDPSITAVGLAHVGGTWTFAGR